MAGRPPKPAVILELENGKQRRSKAELETRKQAEQSLLTKEALNEWPEVKANPEAHKEFLRVRRLLRKINHNDAIYEAVINRYCILIAETKSTEQMKTQYQADIEEFERLYSAGEIDAKSYADTKIALHKMILATDRQLNEKRKMLLQIERENLMTITGALRAIPKKAEKPQESKMGSFLNRKQAGRGET